MKATFIAILAFFLLCGCSGKNNRLLPGERIIEQALLQDLEEDRARIAKFYMDNQWDVISKETYYQSEAVYRTAHRLLKQIDNVDSCLLKIYKKAAYSQIMSNMKQLATDTLHPSTLSRLQKMPEASEKAHENKLILLAYTNHMLAVLKTNLIPFCGVIQDIGLLSIGERNRIRLGESFVCLTTLQKSPNVSYKEYPVRLEKISRNGKLIVTTGIRSKFENHYIEYTPVLPGTYTLFFSQILERPSGKKESYHSEVSFTVVR